MSLNEPTVPHPFTEYAPDQWWLTELLNASGITAPADLVRAAKTGYNFAMVAFQQVAELERKLATITADRDSEKLMKDVARTQRNKQTNHLSSMGAEVEMLRARLLHMSTRDGIGETVMQHMLEQEDVKNYLELIFTVYIGSDDAGRELAVTGQFVNGITPGERCAELTKTVETLTLQLEDARRLTAEMAERAFPAAAEFQYRERPNWDEKHPWTPWKPCDEAFHDTRAAQPIVNEWLYEVRALCVKPPVADKPHCDNCHSTGRLEVDKGWTLPCTECNPESKDV